MFLECYAQDSTWNSSGATDDPMATRSECPIARTSDWPVKGRSVPWCCESTRNRWLPSLLAKGLSWRRIKVLEDAFAATYPLYRISFFISEILCSFLDRHNASTHRRATVCNYSARRSGLRKCVCLGPMPLALLRREIGRDVIITSDNSSGKFYLESVPVGTRKAGTPSWNVDLELVPTNTGSRAGTVPSWNCFMKPAQ